MSIVDKDGKPVSTGADGAAVVAEAKEHGTGWWCEPHGIAKEQEVEWLVWRVRGTWLAPAADEQ